MMANKQHLPLISWFQVTRALPGSPVLDSRSRRGLAIGKCSGVARIIQHLANPSATRQSPNHLLSSRSWFGLWYWDLFFPEPDRRLPRTSELMKLLKDTGDRLLHLTIGRHFNLALFGADETYWHFPQRKAATHLLLKSFAGALSRAVQPAPASCWSSNG